VKSTLRGKETWQLREISGGTGFGQTSLFGHFGLGDATTVDTVRVDWPSGAIQELHQVNANQTLIVTEPPKLEGAKPYSTGCDLSILGIPGSNYLIETSTDLASWTGLLTVTNSARRTVFTDASAAGVPRRFYRARLP
jgi:hypothetical protein